MSSDEVLELRRISKILMLANSEVIESELSKLATTDERKRMWVLMDGQTLPQDLQATCKVSQPAVSRFLTTGKAAGLIDYEPRGPPRRILDYVPPAWLDLVAIEKGQPQIPSDKTERSL